MKLLDGIDDYLLKKNEDKLTESDGYFQFDCGAKFNYQFGIKQTWATPIINGRFYMDSDGSTYHIKRHTRHTNKIVSIKIPTGVNYVDIRHCDNLKELIIPNSVECIVAENNIPVNPFDYPNIRFYLY